MGSLSGSPTHIQAQLHAVQALHADLRRQQPLVDALADCVVVVDDDAAQQLDSESLYSCSGSQHTARPSCTLTCIHLFTTISPFAHSCKRGCLQCSLSLTRNITVIVTDCCCSVPSCNRDRGPADRAGRALVAHVPVDAAAAGAAADAAVPLGDAHRPAARVRRARDGAQRGE